MNSRELVLKALNFENPGRTPRQLWDLPWAKMNFPEQLQKIKTDFPDDIIGIGGFSQTVPKTVGEKFEVGEFIDEWGCIFTNKQQGIHGETKEYLIKDEDWEDIDNLRTPDELLDLDRDKVNDFCRNTDKFVMFANVNPFERLQYIRGTENLFVDLMLRPQGLFEAIDKIHHFNCKLLEAWAKTDVDALMFMDDWGSQTNLLINPNTWVEIFKPLYKDYVDIAHKNSKKIFMHSDGYIVDIIPHLIDIRVDALNCQVFCMGTEILKPFKGKITFWGEIDRQNLLPFGSTEDIENAVKSIKESLWQDGGVIAQCEFGPGANPENVYMVFEAWDKI